MPSLALTLLQGNIPQDETFEPGSGVPLALRWYREQLLAVQQGLALAPETAIPLLPAQLPPGYLEPLQQHYAHAGRAALLGVPLGDSRSGYTNSAMALQDGAAPWRYDKRHLLPFGEFIPTGFHWFTRALNIPLGDFRRGAVQQPALVWQGQRLAINICYEDVFGEELAADFADPAQSPHVLVNLSNLGWFGDGVALDQHLHIARLRALEFERPLVLVTNTGISAVVDATGRVTHALPRGQRAVLPASVQGREGRTPYATWSAELGLAPLALAALLVLGLAARRRSL
jgi:apolipoprotein N-acyltransferase